MIASIFLCIHPSIALYLCVDLHASLSIDLYLSNHLHLFLFISIQPSITLYLYIDLHASLSIYTLIRNISPSPSTRPWTRGASSPHAHLLSASVSLIHLQGAVDESPR